MSDRKLRPALPLAVAVAIFAIEGRAPAARAADPEAAILMNKGLEQLEAWDVEGAAAQLEELVARRPGTPETAFLRGRVLFEQGKYDEAVKAYQDASARAGDNEGSFDTHLRLAKNAAEEVRGAKQVESAHFIFFAKAEKDLLLAPYALEALEKAWSALTQDLGYSPTAKTRIEIYDTPQALARVSPLSVAEIKGSGTIALCKYNRLMVTSPRALLRGYPWLDTVSHEFVHYLVTRKGRNTVPIWLQEGLAKFLETRWRGPPGLAVDELQEALLLKAARNKELISFAAMHPSIAKLPTQEKAALAFAEVEAAMRLLYERSGQAGLTELVAAMASGMTGEQAVAQAYGKSFREFEADWRADVARPRGKLAERIAAVGRTGPRKLVFKEDVKGEKGKDPLGDAAESPHEPKNPEARRAVRLGELFFGRGRWGAAAIEYGRARQLLTEEDPVVARRYAFAEIQNGHLPQAETALRRAVEKDPQDSTAQVLYAQVMLSIGQTDGAGKALAAAVAVDPFDPRLHKLWADLATVTNDAPLKARETRALALLSGREQVGHTVQSSKDQTP